MIPQKIELKNFLCYGDSLQTIDFKDYNLICLSGKNGHGKSALLDAMTWALWGQARKIMGAVKADEGVLRIGQTQMMVTFEFILGGRLYRVRREFSKTYGKPYAALDFQLFDEEHNTFISLTDKTIRETQAVIEKTINLDFDTFLNTAFLKQNHSNEFSQKSPKERKQILANILGLTRYDTLQQAALEKAKQFNDEKKLLLKLQERDEEELEKHDEIKKELNENKTILKSLTHNLSEAEKKLFDHEQQLKSYEEKKQHHALLSKHNTAQNATIKEQADELKELYAAWKKTHAKALKLPNIKKLEHEKKLLEEREQQLIKQQQQSLALDKKIIEAERHYDTMLQKLRQDHTEKHNALRLTLEKHEVNYRAHTKEYERYKELLHKKKTEHNELDKKASALKNKLITAQSFHETYTITIKQFEKRRSFYQTIIQKANFTDAQLKELIHKKKAIDNKQGPACPLCEQILTAKRKQFLSTQFNKQFSFSQHRHTRLAKIIPILKKLLLEQHANVEALNKEKDLFLQTKLQHEEIVKKQKTLLQEEKELTTTQAELYKKLEISEKILIQCKADLEKHAAAYDLVDKKNEPLQELNTIITTLKKEHQRLNFNEDEYKTLQQKRIELDKDLTSIASCKDDLAQQVTRKQRIHDLCSIIKKLKKQADEHKKELAAIGFKPEDQNIITTSCNTLKASIKKTLQDKEQRLQILGQLESSEQRLMKLHDERKQRIKALQSLEYELDHYQILAQTFSKNGIQALLIEEAIPEIEEEANVILSRLTNNQAQIFIESLRDLKRGGVKETLIIKIADAAGVRPYEMYSGGEAFRIDFSLRIAISKLLARRAGTALQTLIIDEGFGSQDEEGLAHLMSAIHAIQHDFSKIIIVSHLATFKDNFPVHFLVEKHPSGSMITVEERG